MQVVFMTGANGFIGKALKRDAPKNIKIVGIDREELSSKTYENKIEKGSSVIHLAARVHIMKETSTDPLEEYRKVNRDMTVNLAKAALAAGVRNFIFISTVAVFGRFRGGYIDDSEQARPDDPYGISKAEAETALEELFSGQSASQCIILRIPMVYGPENKGNMLPLLKAASMGIPLPLKAAKGKRSMLYVRNLCDAVFTIINSSKTFPNNIRYYFVNDGNDLTSSELYSAVCRAYSGGKGVFWAPEALLRAGGIIGTQLNRILGINLPLNKEVISKLFDAYRFSSDTFKSDYGWMPPCTPEQGIRETVTWHSSLNNSVSI